MENVINKHVKELTDKLETGIKNLFESDRYKEYLKTMSKFHNYSFNNVLPISCTIFLERHILSATIVERLHKLMECS